MKTNPTKDRLLILCYLSLLKATLEQESDFSYSRMLLSVFDKEDSIAVVRWLYDQQIPEEFGDIETMENVELLDLIGNDECIVSYLIEYWRNKTDYPVTTEKVDDVLSRLQMKSHYLMDKIIANWDEHDHTYYRSLCEKAGIPRLMYGIFNEKVSDEDKYIIGPLVPPFPMEMDARILLTEMADKMKVKIMPL